MVMITNQQGISFEVPRVNELYRMNADEKQGYFQEIKCLLQRHNAVLIAHYYTAAEIQELAEITGGCVADSLQMARFGKQHPASTLVVAGVRFMGETAKILSPEKRVLMPDLSATCSMDLGCPTRQFAEFIQQHPDRIVVVYANTSADVKALADWVVTSSIAVDVVRHLANNGGKILWAPDLYLGDYIQKQTGADLISWQGSCVVHEEFKADGIKDLKQQYPDAGVLVHPESPAEVIALADNVGSTSQLLKAASELPHKTLIVATDRGIFYKMQQQVPNKTLLAAPTYGVSGTCQCCAHCPWMAMNDLSRLKACLERDSGEVLLSQEVISKALKPIEKMVAH